MDNSKIYVAFRFQVEMPVPFEGDAKIDKSKRVLEHILKSLNVMNAKGVDVKGTWCIEKEITYNQVLPNHCEDLLNKINMRLSLGDELEFTSSGNVMMTVLNNKECKSFLKSSVKKEDKSPNDPFNTIAPIMRPSNNLMSPSLIPFFKSVGISAISLYYSNSSYTSFTNLISHLSPEKRYNPIDYFNSSTDEKITLLPSVNAVDILSNFGIKNYVKKMRKMQKSLEKQTDMLLIVDVPFDDEFWYGFFASKKQDDKSKTKMSYSGLYKMLSQLEEIEFVKFTTPYEYLKTHSTKGEVKSSFDIADGSFEGYCSLAEKWENTHLFKDVEKARYNAYVAEALAKTKNIDVEKECDENIKLRLKALNSSFYGKSCPKLDLNCLEAGENAVEKALTASCELLDKVRENRRENKLRLYVDNPYQYLNEGANGVIFVENDSDSARKYVLNGKVLRSFTYPYKNVDGILLGNARGMIEMDIMTCDAPNVIKSENKRIENQQLKLILMPSGAVKLIYKNDEFIKRAFKPVIVYNGKQIVGNVIDTQVYNLGDTQVLKVIGEIKIKKQTAFYEYSFAIMSGVPAVYFDGLISYPNTQERKNTIFSKGELINFDEKFEEVLPFEISLSMKATDEKPFKIIRQNFFGEQFSTSIADLTVGKNRHIDSLNNHITAGYVAVSNGERGIMLTECVDKDFNFAFCPMRVGHSLGDYNLKLNPFGTYHGKQRKNNLTKSYFSNSIARKFYNHFNSYAPSYNGKTTEVSMMIAPFYGEAPSEELIRMGQLSAYPPKQI